MVLARELARRLDQNPGGSQSGFTARILASLTVADLWISNVEPRLRDADIPSSATARPNNQEERDRAEAFKKQGNEAISAKRYSEAIEFYTEAMKIDCTNATFRANRCAALTCLGKFQDAVHDAYAATLLDPKYAKAWARLGLCQLKLEENKNAVRSYRRAIELTNGKASESMEDMLEKAKKAVQAELDAIDNEQDPYQKNILHNKYLDQDWTIDVKKLEEKVGYGPNEAIEIQTLMGDPIDNVPGIPGVGEKTAAKLVKKYGEKWP